MLVFGRLHRVAISITDVENNFAKDEALSRFMIIWRRAQSWLSLVEDSRLGEVEGGWWPDLLDEVRWQKPQCATDLKAKPGITCCQ